MCVVVTIPELTLRGSVYWWQLLIGDSNHSRYDNEEKQRSIYEEISNETLMTSIEANNELFCV